MKLKCLAAMAIAVDLPLKYDLAKPFYTFVHSHNYLYANLFQIPLPRAVTSAEQGLLCRILTDSLLVGRTVAIFVHPSLAPIFLNLYMRI